jgi:hypothetical protein
MTAYASGYHSADSLIAVQDNEHAALTLSLPASATKGDGLLKNAGTITLDRVPASSVVVNLSSSKTNVVSLPTPPVAIIPAGYTSAAFDLRILDDGETNGPQAVTVTAHVPSWTDGVASISVFDKGTGPVTLRAGIAAGQWYLSWPGSASGYGVDLATNLASPILWSPVTNQIILTNGEHRVLLPPVSDNQIFRLRYP